MTHLDMATQQLLLAQQTADAGSANLLVTGLGVLVIIIGITLWLMGQRLARPICAALWVVLGIMVAGGVCSLIGDGGLLPLWLVAGGIAAGALGWVMYRLCLAVALAVVLAVVAPAALHLFHVGQNQPAAEGSLIRQNESAGSLSPVESGKAVGKKIEEAAQDWSDDLKKSSQQASEKMKEAARQAVDDAKEAVLGSPKPATDSEDASDEDAVDEASGETKDAGWKKQADEAVAGVKKKIGDMLDGDGEKDAAAADDADSDLENTLDARGFVDTLHTLARGPWEKLAAAWQEMPSGGRSLLLMASAIGGLAGFLIGLLIPKTAAWAGSSLLGTICMAAGAGLLLTQYNPSMLDSLGQRLSQCLLAMGLITLLGMLIQWILSRRQADN